MSWFRPAPVPAHLLVGDHPLVGVALTGGEWLLVAVRLLAAPAVLWLGGAWTLLPLSGLLLGLWALSRRRPRACAAPIGEEALFLGGCALLAALGSHDPGAIASLVGGLGTSLLLVLLLLGAVWAQWGRRPTLVQMRRPWFRVLGDNPATVTLVAKVRLADEPLQVELPRCAYGPVSAVLYSPRLRTVARAPWESLRDDYEAGTALATLSAPPGRYLLSVRIYRPWSDLAVPVVRRPEAA